MNHYIKRWYLTYQGFFPSSILIMVCFAAFVFGIVPLATKLMPMQEENQKLGSENVGLKAKLQLLNSLDEAELLAEFDETSAAVPGERLIPSILTTLDGVATKGNLAVNELTMGIVGGIATNSASRGPEDKKIGAVIVPFSASIVGTAEQQKQFLDDAISVRRLMRITGFKLSLNEQSALETRYEMEAFYAPFPKTIGSVSEKLTPLSSEETATLEKLKMLPIISQQSGLTGPLPEAKIGETVKEDPFSL